MENSNIEWCDHTWNGWIGCTPVSPGCANCYAAAQDKFRHWTAEGFGKGKPRKRTSAKYWRQPLIWNEKAEGQIACACGFREQYVNFPTECPRCHSVGTVYRVRPRVFCGSLCDWLDDEVPIEWFDDFLSLIQRCQNLDFLLLTKRPENWLSRMQESKKFGDREDGLGSAQQKDPSNPDIDTNVGYGHCVAADWIGGLPPKNVWIGTTVENQEMADKRKPALLSIPAKVRFLSCEPLLGPVNLGLKGGSEPKFPEDFETWSEAKREQWFNDIARATYIARCSNGLDWVICGGESGPSARPMEAFYAQELRDQCKAAGVPFLFKQWGEYIPKGQIWADGETVYCGPLDFKQPGKKATGRLLDGVEHNEFPC